MLSYLVQWYSNSEYKFIIVCIIRKMEITLSKYENHNLLPTFQIFLIIVLPYKTLMILAQPFFFFLFFLLSYNYVVSHTRDCLDDNLNIYLFNICRETSTVQFLIKIKFMTWNYKRNLTMATYNFELFSVCGPSGQNFS